MAFPTTQLTNEHYLEWARSLSTEQVAEVLRHREEIQQRLIALAVPPIEYKPARKGRPPKPKPDAPVFDDFTETLHRWELEAVPGHVSYE